MSLGLLDTSSIHLNMCLYGNDEKDTNFVRSQDGGNFLDQKLNYQAKKVEAQQVATLFDLYGIMAKITGIAIAALALLCFVAKSSMLKWISCLVFVPLSLVGLVGGQDLSNTAINIRTISEKGNQYLRYNQGKLQFDIAKIGQCLQQNTLFVGTIINKILEKNQRAGRI